MDSQGLWGNRELAFFNDGNMSRSFKENRDQNGFWGAIWHFFLGNIQNTCLGIREILEIFLGTIGTQTFPRGPQI